MHPFAELISLSQQILLLISKPFELAFNLLALLLLIRFFQCGLQLRQFLIQIFLTPGKFFQTIKHLPDFTFLGVLLSRFLRLLLRLVAIFILFDLQVVELLLPSLL